MKPRNICQYIIITTKNSEEDIEYTIRSIVSRLDMLYQTVPEIIVIDKGSTDETENIITRVSEEYNFVHILNKENYKEGLLNIID